MESNPEKREILIRIYSGEDARKRAVSVIDISNRGKQIPGEVISHLFEPYYTTKEEKGGTGIGLYLTREIIESHMGGLVELFNIESGVCCRIMIPKEEPYE